MSMTRKTTVYRVIAYEVEVPEDAPGGLEKQAQENVMAALRARVKTAVTGRRYFYCPLCSGAVAGVSDEGPDFMDLDANIHAHLNECPMSSIKARVMRHGEAVMVDVEALHGTVESHNGLIGFACPVCFDIVADAEGIELHTALKTYLKHAKACPEKESSS